jgi:23S rRNA (cytidine1920-2'-O)/16S rRNA (cytidine1409-2'-O)-methyltransferase
MPAATRARLDVVIAERGLAPSRERARALILAGRVRVDGVVVDKAGTPVTPHVALEVTEPDFPWVGRGGVKLAHALDVFRIAVAGREALDIGASTGGFTDVLLARGSTRVTALDVGHGQLDWRLREDPRVIVLERRNARGLDQAWLPGPVDIVTIDVSFISLRLILPAVPAVLRPGADIVALVKPQFEAGRKEVGKGGIVRDRAVHEAVIERVSDAAVRCGLTPIGRTASPITGATGNQEYLLHLRSGSALELAGSRKEHS